jgi:hypothetical protein
MEELNNFRRFLNEEIMIGDTVVLKGDDDKMKVLSVRDMFASDLKAYGVENSEGEQFEYSEDQIKKVNLEEMDEESWNDKNSPARGDQLRDPKKVGQATGPYSIRKEGIEENMYIDDEEFEMEMGRSKKDSLKKEMIIHVDQLLDGNIDMNDFINVVEDILSDLK